MEPPQIKGFLKTVRHTAAGKPYRGRYTCPDVQWTGDGKAAFATFTATASEIADAADSGMLWTDQDVQRGIVPGLSPQPEREISLATGYPDPTKYIFDADNADDIVEKLLAGERLFLDSLVWNLRPGSFEAYWDKKETSIYLYSGRIYLPDSHHRHQAIIKAVRLWRESPKEFPHFSGDKQFKVELYFLSKEDEGNYFFDKNQRPKPTAKSKAFDLSTLDDLSVLAKKVIENSKHLQSNVNRVTDRLTASNSQVVTLSTMREMMKTFAPADGIDASELDGLAIVAAGFYDHLAEIRSELGHLGIKERREVRSRLIVDAAVMMHGYAALMRDFNADLAKFGPNRANKSWQLKLKYLSSERAYTFGRWHGDLFDKANPLWQRVGIVKPGKTADRLTVINTGGARSEAGRVLRQLLALNVRPKDIRFLAER